MTCISRRRHLNGQWTNVYVKNEYQNMWNAFSLYNRYSDTTRKHPLNATSRGYYRLGQIPRRRGWSIIVTSVRHLHEALLCIVNLAGLGVYMKRRKVLDNDLQFDSLPPIHIQSIDSSCFISLSYHHSTISQHCSITTNQSQLDLIPRIPSASTY